MLKQGLPAELNAVSEFGTHANCEMNHVTVAVLLRSSVPSYFE